ncbi:MAG: DUF692 domain-containing protein [Oligoflexia bacterium]|nr:DUF692 domain-containing protein [Oligoflexia bacterium]
MDAAAKAKNAKKAKTKRRSNIVLHSNEEGLQVKLEPFFEVNKNGLGLRSSHYQNVLEDKPDIGWFEVISENFMKSGGRPRRILEQIRQDYPIVLHGVSLGIGSIEPLNEKYLQDLEHLIERVQPMWVSDHLCWGRFNSHYAHDLLPLPYTEETLRLLTDRISALQDRLKRSFVFENVSSYLNFKSSEMTEWEFISEIVKRTNCKILLDINNIYVSARNHHFDALEFLKNIPKESIQQIHLAGHSDFGHYINDTHDQDVCDDVWALYARATELFGFVPSMIERDDNIPDFSELYAEFKLMNNIQLRTLNGIATRAPSKGILESPATPTI